MITTTVRLPQKLFNDLLDVCKKRDRSQSYIFRLALEYFLEHVEDIVNKDAVEDEMANMSIDEKLEYVKRLLELQKDVEDKYGKKE